MLHPYLLKIVNRGKNYHFASALAGLFGIGAAVIVLTICVPKEAAAQGAILSCSSDNGQRVTCPANTRGGVRMVRQLSGTACQEGATWGYDARGIWVDRGCRAEFEIVGGGQGRFGNANAAGGAQGLQRRAQIVGNGSGDRGKCTVEVVVDGAAEVEIRGDNGVIRNLSGQQPQWRRFECTGPMPASAADFRFSGVDGRGRQQLISDPRNGGVAVVRIEDPQGGAEGYTFDITWTGGAGYPGGSGIGAGGGYGDRRTDQEGYYRGRRTNGAFSNADAVRVCEEAVRQQATERFNTSDLTFQRVAAEDNPGPRDVVTGIFGIRRGAYGRDEMHRFSCSVNFDNGRVRSVQIDASEDGRYAPGYDNRNGSSNQVVQQCERAVRDRLRREGYESVEFQGMNPDNRSGRNDVMVGNARGARGNGFDSFEFSCSLDLNNGSVRSVDVRRR